MKCGEKVYSLLKLNKSEAVCYLTGVDVVTLPKRADAPTTVVYEATEEDLRPGQDNGFNQIRMQTTYGNFSTYVIVGNKSVLSRLRKKDEEDMSLLDQNQLILYYPISDETTAPEVLTFVTDVTRDHEILNKLRASQRALRGLTNSLSSLTQNYTEEKDALAFFQIKEISSATADLAHRFNVYETLNSDETYSTAKLKEQLRTHREHITGELMRIKETIDQIPEMQDRNYYLNHFKNALYLIGNLLLALSLVFSPLAVINGRRNYNTYGSVFQSVPFNSADRAAKDIYEFKQELEKTSSNTSFGF